MRSIYIVRHAQKNTQSNMPDREVPLTQDGRKQAARLGAYCKDHGINPAIILSSDAVRTRQTAEHLLQGWEREQEVIFTKELYYNTAGGLLSMVQKLEDTDDSVMMIGHNPGIHQFALLLAGFGSQEDAQKIKLEFPPCAFVGLKLEIKRWSDAAPGQGHIIQRVYPNDL